MAAFVLPNQNMVFVPLDALTAEELNQVVQNIEALAAVFPLEADNLAANAVTTPKIADSAVSAAKINFAGMSMVGTISSTSVDHFTTSSEWEDVPLKTSSVTLSAAGTYKFSAHTSFTGTSGAGEGEFKISLNGSSVGSYSPGSLAGTDWLSTVTLSGSSTRVSMQLIYNGVAVTNGRWGDTTYCFTRIA